MSDKEFRMFVTGHSEKRLCKGIPYKEWKKTEQATRIRALMAGAVQSIRVGLENGRSRGVDVEDTLIFAVGTDDGVERLFREDLTEFSNFPYEMFIRKEHLESFATLDQDSQETDLSENEKVFLDIAEEAQKIHLVLPDVDDLGLQALRWVARGDSGVMVALWDGKTDGRTSRLIEQATVMGVDIWYVYPNNEDAPLPHRIPGWKDSERVLSNSQIWNTPLH